MYIASCTEGIYYQFAENDFLYVYNALQNPKEVPTHVSSRLSDDWHHLSGTEILLFYTQKHAHVVVALTIMILRESLIRTVFA